MCPDQALSSAGPDKGLRAIVEFLSEGIAVFDAEAKLVFANASFREMYPSLSDVLRPGVLWSIFLREAVHRGVMPQPVSKRLDAIESAVDDDPSMAETVQMPAGADRAYTLRIGQTADGGFILSQLQIADDGSAADAAREAELLLRKVLEACPTSLIMSRVANGQVIYRSPAARELLGTAKSSFAHFAHREERADFVTMLLPDAKVDNMRVTCLRANGRKFPADLSARLIDFRGEDVIVANIEDLTHEIAVREELDRQKEQLFQSEKLSALGELLAGVSHELNNPLSIIVGNAEFLSEELEGTGLERRVEKLSQAAHRCVRIVRSFLSLARQEPLDLKPVAPGKLIDAALEAAAGDAEAAGVELAGAPLPGCPQVIADEVQMTQVIINLLTNAIHAIRDAGKGDRISISCGERAGLVRFSVTDNGPGIAKNIRTRIFDPLFTTKDASKGTGVGLAYCHRIIVAHKGQIRLEDSQGAGATFSIDLPRAPAEMR